MLIQTKFLPVPCGQTFDSPLPLSRFFGAERYKGNTETVLVCLVFPTEDSGLLWKHYRLCFCYSDRKNDILSVKIDSEDKKMKRAVIYARYSSDRQTEQSIEGQLRDCYYYAEQNKIIVVGTYIDRAMTGTNDNRADFQRMMRDSDKKLWDYVLVYKLDRFSRNKYEMAIHRKHLKDNGIKILSAKENIPDSPEGILLESLLEGYKQTKGHKKVKLELKQPIQCKQNPSDVTPDGFYN